MRPASAGTPRPTWRGIGVCCVLAFAFAMAWRYGLRSLHAIMIPLAVLLVAAVVSIVRADGPDVRRAPVRDGFVGERRTVEAEIDVDRSIAATVRDAVGDGLAPIDGGNAAETMLEPEGRFAYEVEFRRRGKHQVGPLSIVVTDLLGLVRRRFETDRTTSTVVYPRVYDLEEGSERDLRLLADVADAADSREFDHLREYTRGDPVRHVHWKSAAKRPDDDLLIKEFENDVDRGAATVAAECIPGREDEMATAAASVVTYMLRIGVAVGLTLPDDARPPGEGRDHHRELLGSLAVAEAGEVGSRARERADVVVQADASGTVVLVDDREIPFDRLRGARAGDRDERADRDRRAGGDRRPNRVRPGQGSRTSDGERGRNGGGRGVNA